MKKIFFVLTVFIFTGSGCAISNNQEQECQEQLQSWLETQPENIQIMYSSCYSEKYDTCLGLVADSTTPSIIYQAFDLSDETNVVDTWTIGPTETVDIANALKDWSDTLECKIDVSDFNRKE